MYLFHAAGCTLRAGIVSHVDNAQRTAEGRATRVLCVKPQADEGRCCEAAQRVRAKRCAFFLVNRAYRSCCSVDSRQRWPQNRRNRRGDCGTREQAKISIDSHAETGHCDDVSHGMSTTIFCELDVESCRPIILRVLYRHPTNINSRCRASRYPSSTKLTTKAYLRSAPFTRRG